MSGTPDESGTRPGNKPPAALDRRSFHLGFMYGVLHGRNGDGWATSLIAAILKIDGPSPSEYEAMLVLIDDIRARADEGDPDLKALAVLSGIAFRSEARWVHVPRWGSP